MRYSERFLKKRDTAVLIADLRCSGGKSIVVYLSKDDFAKIRPKAVPCRIEFVFKGGSGLLIDLDIAQYLIKKIDSIYVVDKKSGKAVNLNDDLSGLKKNELSKLLAEYNNMAEIKGYDKVQPVGMTAEAVRMAIRNFRNLGVEVDVGNKDNERID